MTLYLLRHYHKIVENCLKIFIKNSGFYILIILIIDEMIKVIVNLYDQVFKAKKSKYEFN